MTQHTVAIKAGHQKLVADKVLIYNFSGQDVVINHPLPPKPKTEKQIILEQAIQYHKQNIEHNERMIAKYEEELKNESN